MDNRWVVSLVEDLPQPAAFLDEVIGPFNTRMATPLVPTARGIYADDDMVIILFDAAATTKDGQPYRLSICNAF